MLDVYINFNGNCIDAIKFYTKVFHTEKQQIMYYGDLPPNPDVPVTEDTKNLILHTFLVINDSKIMFSDTPPNMPLQIGNNISLVLYYNYANEIKEIFQQLKVGGKVDMDLQETFWSKFYGSVTDKFGISWQLTLNSTD